MDKNIALIKNWSLKVIEVLRIFREIYNTINGIK